MYNQLNQFQETEIDSTKKQLESLCDPFGISQWRFYYDEFAP